MKTHEFTLILKSDPDDDLADKLYGICQDGLLATIAGTPHIDFSREASDLETAIRSAISDVQSAGIKVERVEFQPEILAPPY